MRALSEVTTGKQAYAFLDPTKGRGATIAEAQAIAGFWTISPDGRTIAIVPQGQKTIIEFLRTDGKRLPSIAVKGSRDLQSMVWADDSQALWVSGLVGMEFQILCVNLDGRFKSLWKFPCCQPYPYITSASTNGRYLTFNLMTGEIYVTMLENF